MKNKYGFILSIVALIWAGSFVAVKIGVEEISPILLAFLRFAIASPCMILILFIKKKTIRISIRELPTLLILALTGVTFLYIFQFTGIKYTTAANSAILINTNVIFIAILSSIMLKERFSNKKIIGIILSFLGAVFVVTNGSLSLTHSIKGDALIILSAICWAIYSVMGKRILDRYDPITITTYVFILGTILFIPFMNRDLFNVTNQISFQGWIIIFYLALLCSVFGYVAWYDALAKMDATKVAIFLNLIPLFAMPLSYLILREEITIFLIIGAAFIIYGIYLTEKG
jgi:drug/metabolite transporter (DMT)-like permease